MSSIPRHHGEGFCHHSFSPLTFMVKYGILLSDFALSIRTRMAKQTTQKRAGRHTTLISLAKNIATELSRCDAVTKISPGMITSGLPTLRDKRRIKINIPQKESGSLLVTIRDVRSMQELRVYGAYDSIRECLEQYAKKHNLLCNIS